MKHLPDPHLTISPKIIVAEDDVLLRLTISDLLRQRGFEVFEAADATEAISILRSTADIDLVATDMDMRTAQDGIFIAQFVEDHCAGIPVVLASAHRPVDATLFAVIFIKPYAPEGLVNWIVARLRRARISDRRNA